MHQGAFACANCIRELTGSHEADCPLTVSDQVASTLRLRRDARFAVTPSHGNQVEPMITARSLNIGLVNRVDLRERAHSG